MTNRKYQCKICGESFNNYDDLYWHIDQEHNTNPEWITN